MRHHKKVKTTLGDLVVKLTDEVAPIARDSHKTHILVSYMLRDIFARCYVRPRSLRLLLSRYGHAETPQASDPRYKLARRCSTVALGVLLLSSPGITRAGTGTEQLKASIGEIQRILTNPALKGEAKKAERRRKLEEVIHSRFDFNEMAKRSLGAEWKKRSPEEKKQFVRLFTNLLENAYLDKIESYNGEKVRYVNERQDDNFSEVDTKVTGNNGEEFSLNYRLHKVNEDWKVFDVVVENISLVNNYRAQFRRVLARSSFEELVQTMKQKSFSAPAAKS
jgi:phospholipid transport system substrate-binding protein